MTETIPQPDTDSPPGRTIPDSWKADPADCFTWVGPANQARLRVSDDVADMVRRDRLSASTAGAMRECPARWVADKVLSQPDDPFRASDVGSTVHDGLQVMFEAPPGQRTRQMMDELMWESAIRQVPDDPDRQAELHQMLMDAQDAFWLDDGKRIIDPQELVDEVQCEIELGESRAGKPAVDLEIGGVPVQGRIDLLIARPNGDREVVDFKTGKPRPAGATQQRVYVWALRELGHTVNRASLWYTHVNHAKVSNVSLTDHHMRQTLDGFVKSWHVMNDSCDRREFDTKQTPLCGWCPLVQSCPTAASNDRVDRTGLAFPKGLLQIPVEGRRRRRARTRSDDVVEPVGSVSSLAGDDPTVPVPVPHAGPAAGPTTTDPTTTISQEHPMTIVDHPTPNTVAHRGTTPAILRKLPATAPADGSAPWLTRDMDKPWLTPTDVPSLTLSSYETGHLVDAIRKAHVTLSQHQRVVTPRAVRALADTFIGIADAVQVDLFGEENWNRSMPSYKMISRILLNNVLYEMPVPFGEPVEVVQKWRSGIETRVLQIVKMAADMHLAADGGDGVDPDAHLGIVDIAVDEAAVAAAAMPDQDAGANND